MLLWVGLAVAAAAVLAAAFLLLRRFGRDHPLGEADALIAAATLPGFTARTALVGDDRRAALVVGEHARVALVTINGSGPRAREVRWQDIRAGNGGLQVGADRPMLVAGVDALDVRRAGDEGWRKTS